MDGQDDEHSIDGWITEAKILILKEETKIIKAQAKEEWLQWKAAQMPPPTCPYVIPTPTRTTQWHAEGSEAHGLRISP